MSIHFKVCGITSVEDADLAVLSGASALGLNLIEASPRYIDPNTAKRIVAHVGTRVLTVLVVADRTLVEMRELLSFTGARCLQLHGSEDPPTVSAVLPHAYKAIRIGCAEDVARASEYPGEYVLTDAKVKGKLGGTGQTFDWSLVLPLSRARKVTLAGGLTVANVAQAIEVARPFCVDVASGVEVEGNPRRKDPGKLAAFGRAVRAV